MKRFMLLKMDVTMSLSFCIFRPHPQSKEVEVRFYHSWVFRLFTFCYAARGVVNGNPFNSP